MPDQDNVLNLVAYRFLILLSGGGQKEGGLTLKHLLAVLQTIGHAFNQLSKTAEQDASDVINLAQSLVHDLAFPGEKRKATIDKEVDATISIDSGRRDTYKNSYLIFLSYATFGNCVGRQAMIPTHRTDCHSHSHSPPLPST